MIGGGFLGGGISIVPAGKSIIYASMTTEDGENIPNAVFKATRTGSTVTVNGSIDGRAELLVDAGHTYTVSVTPAGGSYLNRSQTVATASAKSYAVKFYLYPAKANEASTTASLNALNTSISTHVNKKDNPHAVTKAQVGLGNVDNTSDANKPVSTATNTELAKKVAIAQGSGNASKFALTDASGNLNTFRILTATDIPNLNASHITNGVFTDARIPTTIARRAEVTAHTGRTDNPHAVTKAQVGLGAYPTSPADIGISTATQTALSGKVGKTGNETIEGNKTFSESLFTRGGFLRIQPSASINYAEFDVRSTSDSYCESNILVCCLVNGNVRRTTAMSFIGDGYDTYSEVRMRPTPGAYDVVNKSYLDARLTTKQDKFSLYEHTIRIWTTVAPDKFKFSLTVLNQSPTAFTLPTLREYLGSNVNDFKQCSGLGWSGGYSIDLISVRGGTATALYFEGVNRVSGVDTNLSLDWMQVEVLITDLIRQIV